MATIIQKILCMLGMVNAYAPLLEDNVAIVDVPGRFNPNPIGWADSYSINGNCYCDGVTTYDHDIGVVMVDTPLGVMSIKAVCELLGKGPGREGRPLYNDIQCGNGPANNAGDEDDCPGRTEHGREGCKYIGPKWNFRPHLPPVKAPVKVPVKAPVKVPVKVPLKAPEKAPVKAPVKVPVKVPIKAPVKAPVVVKPPVVTCGIVRLDLWDANTDKLIKTLLNGAQVCDNKSVSIQTIATECVDSVTMTLTGPNNYQKITNEKTRPFYLFANSGTDIFGQTLARGSYTIVVVPDGKTNLATTISFTVRGC